MKIIYIATRLNVGGVARHVAWIAGGMHAAGHRVSVVAGTLPAGEDDMSYFVREQGVEPQYVKEINREVSLKDVHAIWKLYRLFVRERPDIVDTHTTKAGTLGRAAGLLYRYLTASILIGRPRRVRFVHTYHGHVYHSFFGRAKSLAFLVVEKVLTRLITDKVIVLSPLQYKEIHGDYNVGRASQFAVIRLGIDTSVYENWQERRHILRDEIGVGKDELLVGCVGRLAEIKNVSMFIRAAALYKNRYGTNACDATLRVRFVVIGDGLLREQLQAEAVEAGVADDFVFTGQRDDPEVFYPGLDIVAMTARNEGTSLTVIEGMANERAVITTATGGVPDLLGAKIESVNNNGGQYEVCERAVSLKSEDAAGFCEGLRRLVTDENLRREFGRRGKFYVETAHSRERLLMELKGLYNRLAPPVQNANQIIKNRTIENQTIESNNHRQADKLAN